jgi:hypothetical protein
MGRVRRVQIDAEPGEVVSAGEDRRGDPVQPRRSEVTIGVLDDVEFDLVGLGVGARDRALKGRVPVVVLELQRRIDRPDHLGHRFGPDRVEGLGVLGGEGVDIGASVGRHIGRAQAGEMGDGGGRVQRRVGVRAGAVLDIEEVVGALVELTLGIKAGQADLEFVGGLPFEARRPREDIAPVLAHELADLAGIVDPARILGDQGVVNRIAARNALVPDLDRAEAVGPAVDRDRVPAEVFFLEGQGAEDREILGQVGVVADRVGRRALVAEFVVFVGGFHKAAVPARQGRCDLQIDDPRQAAGDVGGVRRLDDGDPREDVGVEGAQRRRTHIGRGAQDRIGETRPVQCRTRERARQAAQADGGVARVGLAVDLHARKTLDGLADVQVGETAQTVRRDGIRNLVRRALGLQGAGVGAAEAGDDDFAHCGRFVGRRRRGCPGRLRLGAGLRGGAPGEAD